MTDMERQAPIDRLATIHVAYAVSRRNGLTSYRAVAVVTNAGCKGYHTHRLAIDDSGDAAMEGAIQYIRETYRREGLPMPAEIRKHGKRCSADLELVTFARESAR